MKCEGVKEKMMKEERFKQEKREQKFDLKIKAVLFTSDNSRNMCLTAHMFCIEKVWVINDSYMITMLWHAFAVCCDDHFCCNTKFIQ